MSESLFSPIEDALAERLLAPYPEHMNAAFAIKALLFAAKKGHLCLYVGDDKVEPSMRELLNLEQGDQLIKESLWDLPPALVQEIDLESSALKPICKQGSYYYFQRYFRAERTVYLEWQRLLKTPPRIASKQGVDLGESLLAEQKAAIELACQKSFVILSGGPGTGKTFTAGRMVKALVQMLPFEAKEHFKIALAAPTGKAAAQLEGSLNKAFADFQQLNLTGQTLHSLLGIGKKDLLDTPLPFDLIIVDESSMIDVELMAKLLASVKAGARLILIGDENQLPPVEAGCIFADLKAMHPFTISLKECLRAELKELVDFGKYVNLGKCEEALSLLRSPPLHRIDPHEIPFKTLLEGVATQYSQNEGGSFCLLTPLRQGPFGNQAINQFIADFIKKHSRGVFRAPIIITANDPKLGLFNGELGYLEKQDPSHELLTAQDKAFFSNGRDFFALMLPRFEYAYCLSVHKSQGSEFDEIFLILPEGSEHFGRKVIYTAITRARKKMTIYGTEEMFKKTLQNNASRLSGIKHLASLS
ncbi:MAG: ATP-dependent DNA helicase [Parachlamydiaceae bacterium]